MATTRAQQIQALSEPVFQRQLAGCLLFAAINVLNEAPTTANHAARIKWATAILQNPTGQASLVGYYVLTNPTIAAEAGNPPGASGTPFLDSDMDFVVAGLFDQFATQFAGA